MADTDLWEYADYWENPLVYIHSDDHEDANVGRVYVLKSGTKVSVEPRRHGETNEYIRRGSFQFFSMGPDQTLGTEDDLHWGDL